MEIRDLQSARQRQSGQSPNRASCITACNRWQLEGLSLVFHDYYESPVSLEQFGVLDFGTRFLSAWFPLCPVGRGDTAPLASRRGR